jgi:sulfhydrogenase subunit beta (sulfur reductase)
VQAQKFTPVVIAPGALDDLIAILHARGFRVLGPRIRDGAIIYDDLSAASQLPVGWTDEQQGGSYRLNRRQDAARFGYAVGPHSWKRFLFRPEVLLWRSRRPPDDEMVVEEEPNEAKPMAFIGVRSCELHAIEIQDRVFMGGRHVDRDYANQREGAFLVAVNCITAGGTCFCASMGTGPKASAGYDLALTELLDGEHRFLAEAGTERGAELLAELPQQPATAADLTGADAAIDATSRQMGRTMDTDDIRNLLARNLEHPRWDEVADRCLSCGNCTQVCPTCFCSSVEDTSDLSGETAERTRVWDTCFSVDYSHIHGGSIRPSTRSRYRQWMTHKLGTWIDQFGTSGCVGCGRCITWCPVAIDITEEVAAIRSTDGGDATAA